jgi:hypothetical protein
MGLLVTTALSLALWIVLWAIGLKAFDGILIAGAIILIAASARIIAPFLPGNRAGPDR